MSVYYQSENQFQLSEEEQSLLSLWIEKAITSSGFMCGEITYIYCSDDYLLEINQKYLNHDSYTDIITFDYTQDRLISGDLFISTDRVKENAQSFDVSFKKELSRVMIHGVLHLMGMEDSTLESKAEMRAEEDKHLLHLGVD